MILKELLDYFNIEVDLPPYLYDECFNDVFMRGELFKFDDTYKIIIKTQKRVIHTMIINQNSDYPVIISSELPNGAKNGVKFGQDRDELTYI